MEAEGQWEQRTARGAERGRVAGVCQEREGGSGVEADPGIGGCYRGAGGLGCYRRAGHWTAGGIAECLASIGSSAGRPERCSLALCDEFPRVVAIRAKFRRIVTVSSSCA